jgi:DNA anti-recombination protein RmuC
MNNSLDHKDSQVELGVLKSVVSKLDASIEKIASLNADVAKLLAVHEQRLNSIERDYRQNDADIKEIHSRITTQIQLLSDKMDITLTGIDERMEHSTEKATERTERCKKSFENDFDDISSRITQLEQWRWWVTGIAIAVGYMISVAGKFFQA